jgi:hypothetical protein
MALRAEELGPGVLGVRQHDRHEVHQRLLCGVDFLRGGGRRAALLEHRANCTFGCPEQCHHDGDEHRAAADRAAADAHTSSIFDVVATATRLPSHGALPSSRLDPV